MLKNTHFNEFEKWLIDKNLSEGYIRDTKNQLAKFFKLKLDTSRSIVEYFRNNKDKKYLLLGFRNFLKFCNEYDYIDHNEITYIKDKIKSPKKSGIDSYVPSKEEISNSLEIVKSKYPEFLSIYQFMIESGCRFTEAKNFITTFEEKNIEIKDRIALYRNFYLKGNKSSFYLFFTKETYDKLSFKLTERNFDYYREKISNDKEVVSLKYLRKYNFTLLIKAGIDFEITNFLQGRCSSNIGFNHYLAKKEIAMKEYEKIINSLKNK